MGPAFDFVGIMTRRDYEKRNLNWKISVGILISCRDYDQLNFGCRDYEKRNFNWKISVGILISCRDYDQLNVGCRYYEYEFEYGEKGWGGVCPEN